MPQPNEDTDFWITNIFILYLVLQFPTFSVIFINAEYNNKYLHAVTSFDYNKSNK
jgi:hypothetical protein